MPSNTNSNDIPEWGIADRRLGPKKHRAGDKSITFCGQCQYRFPSDTPLAGKQCLRDASCNIGCKRFCYQHASMSKGSKDGHTRSICKDTGIVRARVPNPVVYGKGFMGLGAGRDPEKTSRVAQLLNEGKIKYSARTKGLGYAKSGEVHQRSGRGVHAGQKRPPARL
jgi:hypothetical protein